LGRRPSLDGNPRLRRATNFAGLGSGRARRLRNLGLSLGGHCVGVGFGGGLALDRWRICSGVERGQIVVGLTGWWGGSSLVG
jgi:hypothetical protein